MNEQLSLERADILGFSDGGNIALVFALEHPEKVERLILYGANLDTRGVKRSVQLPIELGYKMAARFAGKSADAKKNAEMLGLMVNDPNIPKEALSKVSAKTLVIAGTKDMIKREHTELIGRSIPDAKTVFIRGSHFIAAKNPTAFNSAVKEFLLEDDRES